MRYIWEGDPYTPDIRNYIDSLEQAEKSRVTYGIRINAIEEALERARLDSVDDAKTSKEIVRLWVAYYAPQNLEKSLADLSHRLDRLAAQVDGITLGHFHSDSHTVKDLKRRKKLLSKQLVLHMERCDALLASYQVLGEEQ